MALAIGNKTVATPNPGGNSYTISHNQNVGDDGYLLVSVVMANSVNFSGVTYNGVAMTQLAAPDLSGEQQMVAFYGLEAPATGSNDLVVSFSGPQWNHISLFACSFTGSSGVGATGMDGLATQPHSKTLNTTANSVIYALGVSTQQVNEIEIDGAARTLEFSHNTNREVSGALSATGVTDTTRTVVTKLGGPGTITNYRVEIKEVSKVQGSFMHFMGM